MLLSQPVVKRNVVAYKSVTINIQDPLTQFQAKIISELEWNTCQQAKYDKKQNHIIRTYQLIAWWWN